MNKKNPKLEKQKKELFKQLEKMGIGSIVVDYDGSGDDGSITEVRCYEKCDVARVKKKLGNYKKDPMNPKNTKELKITWNSVNGVWGSDGWSEKETTKQVPVEDAVTDFCYTVLEVSGFDWVNNEGGYGSITIDLDLKKISLDHHERITTEERYEREF